jgi:hypothetical protein
MSIDNIGCCGSREKTTYGRGVWSIERDEICINLSNEARQKNLPGGVPHGLRQSRRRNCNTHPELVRACDKCKYPAISTVKSDQATRIQSDSVDAAFRPLERFFCA